MRHAVVEAGLRDADGLRGDVDAAAFDDGARNLEAAIHAAQQIGSRNSAIVERQLHGFCGPQAQLVIGLAHSKAARTFFDDER